MTSGYSSVRVTATGTFLCRLRIRCALKRDKSGISLFPKAPVMEHSQLQFGLDWPSEGCCRSSMPSVNFKIQVHTAYNIPLLFFLVYVEHCTKVITAWEVKWQIFHIAVLEAWKLQITVSRGPLWGTEGQSRGNFLCLFAEDPDLITDCTLLL